MKNYLLIDYHKRGLLVADGVATGLTTLLEAGLDSLDAPFTQLS